MQIRKEVKKPKMIDKRGRVNALPLFCYDTLDKQLTLLQETYILISRHEARKAYHLPEPRKKADERRDYASQRERSSF